MKSIDWNRVMIAWALGSLAVLGATHLTHAQSLSGFATKRFEPSIEPVLVLQPAVQVAQPAAPLID